MLRNGPDVLGLREKSAGIAEQKKIDVLKEKIVV